MAASPSSLTMLSPLSTRSLSPSPREQRDHLSLPMELRDVGGSEAGGGSSSSHSKRMQQDHSFSALAPDARAPACGLSPILPVLSASAMTLSSYGATPASGLPPASPTFLSKCTLKVCSPSVASTATSSPRRSSCRLPSPLLPPFLAFPPISSSGSAQCCSPASPFACASPTSSCLSRSLASSSPQCTSPLLSSDVSPTVPHSMRSHSSASFHQSSSLSPTQQFAPVQADSSDYALPLSSQPGATSCAGCFLSSLSTTPRYTAVPALHLSPPSPDHCHAVSASAGAAAVSSAASPSSGTSSLSVPFFSGAPLSPRMASPLAHAGSGATPTPCRAARLTLPLPPRGHHLDIRSFGYQHLRLLARGQHGHAHLVERLPHHAKYAPPPADPMPASPYATDTSPSPASPSNLLHTQHSRLYVAKVIELTTPSQRLQALDEPKLLQTLQHPCIVKFEEAFFSPGGSHLVIITEYCEGGDLHSFLEDRKIKGERLAEEQVLRWIGGLVEGLKYMHWKEVVHCDLKTSNIFLTADGAVKIGDLGIARRMQQGVCSPYPLGTPMYMPPEMRLGLPLTAKVDCWGLGRVLQDLWAAEKTTGCMKVDCEKENSRARVGGTEEEEGELADDVDRWIGFQRIVCGLLMMKPDDRMSVDEVHAFLASSHLRKPSLSLPSPRLYNLSSSLQSASPAFPHAQSLSPPTSPSASSALSHSSPLGGGCFQSSPRGPTNNLLLPPPVNKASGFRRTSYGSVTPESQASRSCNFFSTRGCPCGGKAVACFSNDAWIQ